MKRINPNRVALFVGVMSAVAAIIYVPLYQRQQRQILAVANEATARMEQQNAVVEHVQFLARYLDSSANKKPGVETVALSVAAQDEKSEQAIQDALDLHFKDDIVQLLPSFFKPSFVADGLFQNAFNGLSDIPKKLELAKFLDALLLASETVTYSTNGADLENVITATARLDITLVPVSGNFRNRSWAFTAAGAGFSPSQARSQAEERLVRQIGADTKMSLTSINHSNQN